MVCARRSSEGDLGIAEPLNGISRVPASVIFIHRRWFPAKSTDTSVAELHSSSDLAVRRLCVAPLSTKAVVELLVAQTRISRRVMVLTCGFVFSGKSHLCFLLAAAAQLVAPPGSTPPVSMEFPVLYCSGSRLLSQLHP